MKKEVTQVVGEEEYPAQPHNKFLKLSRMPRDYKSSAKSIAQATCQINQVPVTDKKVLAMDPNQQQSAHTQTPRGNGFPQDDRKPSSRKGTDERSNRSPSRNVTHCRQQHDDQEEDDVINYDYYRHEEVVSESPEQEIVFDYKNASSPTQVEDYSMPKALRKFLTEEPQGPRFSSDLIVFLEHFGAYTIDDFVRIAAKTFQALINMCGTGIIEEMRDSVVVLRIFGSYMARYLTDKAHEVDLGRFDRTQYVAHFRQVTRSLSTDLRAALRGHYAAEEEEKRDEIAQVEAQAQAKLIRDTQPRCTSDASTHILSSPQQTAPTHLHPNVDHPAIANGPFHPLKVEQHANATGIHGIKPNPISSTATATGAYATIPRTSSAPYAHMMTTIPPTRDTFVEQLNTPF